MLYVALIVVGTGYLCYGAYKLGRRSDVWSVVLAPLLVLVGWRVLLAPPIRPGEGAAIGVVVVDVAIWYFGAVCVLLALILLGTSVYVRRSPVAVGVLLCVVGPAALVLGYRLVTGRRAESTAREAPSAEPRASYLEGYNWALDEGIDADSACAGGSPAFINGCKRAVQRRNDYAKRAAPPK